MPSPCRKATPDSLCQFRPSHRKREGGEPMSVPAITQSVSPPSHPHALCAYRTSPPHTLSRNKCIGRYPASAPRAQMVPARPGMYRHTPFQYRPARIGRLCRARRVIMGAHSILSGAWCHRGREGSHRSGA
eukprot:3940339-Rhodomonas_salina.6